jgi:predicted amidophosphoribosyltransferase
VVGCTSSVVYSPSKADVPTVSIPTFCQLPLEPSSDRFCRHCGGELEPDEPIGPYCRKCVDSI